MAEPEVEEVIDLEYVGLAPPEADDVCAPASPEQPDFFFEGFFAEEVQVEAVDLSEKPSRGGFKPKKTKDSAEAASSGNEWHDIDWDAENRNPPGMLLLLLLLPLTCSSQQPRTHFGNGQGSTAVM